MSQSKAFFAAVLCLLMAGCSGGSSDGGDASAGGGDEVQSDESSGETGEPPEPRELTPVTLEDTASPLERTLTDDQAQAAERVVTDDGETLDAALAGGAVSLTPADTDRPRTVTVAVLNKQGNRFLEFRVNLVNVAGQPVRERAEAWLGARDAVTSLAEDCAIAEVVAGAAYVSQDLEYAAYAALRQGWALPYAGEAPALEDAYRTLANTLNRYERGDTGADGLAAATDDLRREAQGHQRDHGNGPVGDAYQAMPAWAPPPQRRLRYDPASGRISSLVGNASLGSRSGGRWRFDPDWVHLAPVVGDEQLPECGGGPG